MLLYPSAVDLSKFEKNKLKNECFYGLPEKVVFCQNCSYSNQKPNSDKEYKHTRKSQNLLFYLTKKVFVQHAELRRKNVS